MSDSSFTVAVRDPGPGIALADQGKIFEEFQQADNSATKGKGGTGLGLSIAKRIIVMHGGRIWVESEIDPDNELAASIGRVFGQNSAIACSSPIGTKSKWIQSLSAFRVPWRSTLR
jgi:signal transduction histidine kinase